MSWIAAARAARGMAALLATFAWLALPASAVAQDAFEVQVYSPEVDAPGHPGVELHLNVAAIGATRAPPPQLPTNHFFYMALEPSLGLAPNFELGGYLQAAVGPGFTSVFAGVKLRAKVRIPFKDWVDFALNGEVAWIHAALEPNVWGAELRPIVEFRFAKRWTIDVNPIIDVDLAGPNAGQPQFAPCAALRFRINDRWLLSAEYYTFLGNLSRILPWAQEDHALFVASDVSLGSGFDIHFGAGAGLTPASNPFQLTAILGKDW